MTLDQEFESLFRAYQQPITTYLMHLLGSPEQAEELSQDTFLRAYRALSRGVQPEHPKAWLYCIATRTATDYFRRARLRRWLPLWDADANPALRTADCAEAVADQLLVQSVLTKLKPHYRVPLVLHLCEGLSTTEIAEVLDISLSAVKMRLMRAREQFQTAYTNVTVQNREEAYGHGM